MKPQGRGTNSLLRAVHDQQAFGRRPLARRDSLIERARSESQSWTSRKTRGVRPRGEVFFLTSPFIGQCYRPLRKLLISKAVVILARDSGYVIDFTVGQSFWRTTPRSAIELRPLVVSDCTQDLIFRTAVC